MGLSPRTGALPIGQMRQSFFSDSNLSLFQQALNDQFNQLAGIPFLNGRMISAVTISGTTVVDTGLQRKAQGYFVTSIDSSNTIWNDAFDSDLSITLHCSGTAVVDLWVF